MRDAKNPLAKKCTLLKECIDSFLHKNKQLSYQNVADKTEVPLTTIRRIASGNGNPTVETATKIFNALGGDQKLFEYMEEFHPDIYKAMTSYGGVSDVPFIENEHLEYFVNEDYYLLINLLFTRAGTTNEEITHELGNRGVENLKKLIEKGVAIEKNGRYYGRANRYRLPITATKDRIKMALKYYKPVEAGSKNNWMSLQTESLNEQGLSALKKLHQKQYEDRKNIIFNNPTYNGDIKVYSATVASTFLPYNNKE